MSRFRGRTTFWPALAVFALVLPLLSALWLPGALAAPGRLPLPAPTLIVGPPASTPTPTPAPAGDTGPLSAIIWAPDGAAMAVAMGDGVFVYEADTFGLVRSIATGSWVAGLAYSPDGQALASGSPDGHLRTWSTADATLIRTFGEGKIPVESVAFAPNGEQIASGHWHGTVNLWRVSDGALVAIVQGSNTRTRSLAFSPDGALLAMGGADGVVRLWRVGDAAGVKMLQAGGGEVAALAFAPDGSILAAGSGDGSIRLWAIPGESTLGAIEAHSAPISGLGFAPDGRLVSSSADATVRVWRPSDRTALLTIKPEIGPLVGMSIAPNGVRVACGALDGQVRLLDLPEATSGPALVVATVSVATAQPTAKPPATATARAATCRNSAAYEADITIPDNTVLNPNDAFNKTWRVRNDGTCTWGPGYGLQFVSGTNLSALTRVEVLAAGPGASIDVTVPMVAPAAPGLYSSVWQMSDAGGRPFGQQMSVVIQVVGVGPPPPPATPEPPPPPPTPEPPPPPPGVFIELRSDHTTIPAGACTVLHAQVEGVAAAWLDGAPIVGGQVNRTVCPCVATTFTLHVQLMDGSTVDRAVTVEVDGTCAGPTPTPTATPTLFLILTPLRRFPTATPDFFLILTPLRRIATATPTLDVGIILTAIRRFPTPGF